MKSAEQRLRELQADVIAQAKVLEKYAAILNKYKKYNNIEDTTDFYTPIANDLRKAVEKSEGRNSQ